MNWGTLTTNAPASIAMWRIDASQPSLSSAFGASQIWGPPWYTAQRASGMRFSQQINPPTRPTPGTSTTPRSSPAPTPWNTRSCMVGISLRCRCSTPSGPMTSRVLYSDPGRTSSRSFTPIASDTPFAAQASTRRPTSGPSTSTLDAHIRSHSSSHPSAQVAAAAAHAPLG